MTSCIALCYRNFHCGLPGGSEYSSIGLIRSEFIPAQEQASGTAGETAASAVETVEARGGFELEPLCGRACPERSRRKRSGSPQAKPRALRCHPEERSDEGSALPLRAGSARDLRFVNCAVGLIWRRGADSNRRIKVLQTSPLTTWVPRLDSLASDPRHDRWPVLTSEKDGAGDGI